MFKLTAHQQKQVEVIDKIDKSLMVNQASFSMVEPVEDFINDQRIALTSVHFPRNDFFKKIELEILQPLKKIDPKQFFYSNELVHMTVKNIKIIQSPPAFTEVDIKKVQQVFAEVIPKYHKFKAYYYRLLLFPYNLALVGTTDPTLDEIVLELDQKLKEIGVPDNKIYLNSHYFFSNVTLVRFNKPLTDQFKNKVKEISANLKPFSYEIDSITLLSCNAVMNNKTEFATYQLA